MKLNQPIEQDYSSRVNHGLTEKEVQFMIASDYRLCRRIQTKKLGSTIIGIIPMMYTYALVNGMEADVMAGQYVDRFCYPNGEDVCFAIEHWDGDSIPLDGFVKYKGRGLSLTPEEYYQYIKQQ